MFSQKFHEFFFLGHPRPTAFGAYIHIIIVNRLRNYYEAYCSNSIKKNIYKYLITNLHKNVAYGDLQSKSPWTEYGDLRSKSPYSVRTQENTDQK